MVPTTAEQAREQEISRPSGTEKLRLLGPQVHSRNALVISFREKCKKKRTKTRREQPANDALPNIYITQIPPKKGMTNSKEIINTLTKRPAKRLQPLPNDPSRTDLWN